MPLKCLHDAEARYAFNYSASEWIELKTENRNRHHLTMPCCGTTVVLKTSKLGTQFFAHARTGGCTTAPETAEHLLAKNLVAKAVQVACWEVNTEFYGGASVGEEWVADVMAIKDRMKIAIEVQWSRQDQAETKRRQERYKRSGVRGIWLIRHPNLLVEKETPTFRLRYRMESREFLVLLPSSNFDSSFVKNHDKDDPRYWQQEIDLTTFIVGTLNGRLQFAPTVGQTMPVNVSTAAVDCWRCKRSTNIVIGIEFNAGAIFSNHASITATIYDFEEMQGCEVFLNTVFSRVLLKQYGIGDIKRRFSRTAGGEYLSNGCFYCDSLQGRFFDHDYWYEAEVAYSVEAKLDGNWAHQLENSGSQIFRWWFNED